METKVRVLVADPGEDFRKLLSEAIQSEGDMEAIGPAGDGAEALRLCAEEHPDVIVTELVLPKLDGLSLLETLHRSDEPPAPIVVSGFIMIALFQAVRSLARCISCRSPVMFPRF